MKSHPWHPASRRACAVLTFCATLLPYTPAFALEGTDVDHAKRARISYDLRDWPTAIREYRAAYETEPKSEYLFGLAQALRQSRDYAAAIYTFKAYKRLEGISPQQSSAADMLIAKCEEQAEAEAIAPLGNTPAAPADSLAVTADPFAPPQAPGAAAGAASLTASSNQPARTETPSSPPTAFYEDAFGDSLFLVGLAAAGVGTGLLLTGNSAMNDAAARPTEADAREAIDDARQKQVIGGVLLPLGGALVAGAMWRWISIGSGTPQESTGVSVGPGYVGYRGRF